MNQEHLEKFGAIAQPPKEYSSFRSELQKPVENIFKESCGCPPGATENCMADGVDLLIRYPEPPEFPHTAIASLRNLLKQKNIREVIEAGANIFVAGSGVFRKNSITDNVNKFLEAFK